MKRFKVIFLLTFFFTFSAFSCEWGKELEVQLAINSTIGTTIDTIGIQIGKMDFYGVETCYYEALYSWSSNGNKWLGRTIFDAETFERIIPDLWIRESN